VEFLLDPNIWISLLTLTVLEIVLGIDNIIFISILAGKLPKHQQAKARRWGLILALGTRLLLLASLAYIVRLTAPWFTVFGAAISGRDLVLLAGGLFLIYKSTREIHERLEENSSVGGEITDAVGKGRGFGSVLVQIMLLDIVFSLDSVITAVGMASHLWIMVTAVIAAMLVMLLAVNAISRFVEAHPTVKMLALSFLLLVGTALIAEGLDLHIPKGYIYFAMAFSIAVEGLNIRASRKSRLKGHARAS
jgi:predicted tellurium resistance membrane protein TerC